MHKLISGVLAIVLCNSSPAQTRQNGDVINTGKLPSGRKVEMLHWAGTERGYVLISYPKNFNAAKVYHINFAFPGTGGTPGPGIEDRNDGYIGILMSYLAQPTLTNEQHARDHWGLCRQIEKALRKRVPLKVGQRVVSGVSKGGWISFFMSLQAPEGLDGVGIIAAGRDMHMKDTPNLSRSGLSVFVGTGETDPNYPFAQLADSYYRECGIRDYTYEEWLGKGHTSEISARVQEWLNMVAMRGEPKETFVAYCEGEVTAALEKIEKLPDILEQYRAARHLMNSPCMLHVSADFRSKVAAWGRELGTQEKVIGWLKDFNQLRQMVRAEMKIYETSSVEAKHLLKLDANYRKLASQTKFDDIRARAAYAHVRNRKVITMLELRKKAREQADYAALEKKAQKMFEQISSLKQEDKAMMAEFDKIRRELGAARGKLNMDSFHQVEWEGKYVLDDNIKKLINSLPAEPNPHAAYSGVRY